VLSSPPISSGWAGPGWLVCVVLLAAGPTVAGFGLYNVSLTYLPSSVVNLIATSEPVFTAITAYFLFGRLTPSAPRQPDDPVRCNLPGIHEGCLAANLSEQAENSAISNNPRIRNLAEGVQRFKSCPSRRTAPISQHDLSAGMSLVTTAPAPTRQAPPIVTPGDDHPAPIQQSSPRS
jgi:hypothetical protein